MLQLFAAHYVATRLASPPLGLEVEWIVDDVVAAPFSDLFSLEPTFTDLTFVDGTTAARTRKREFHAALAFFAQVADLTTEKLPGDWVFRGTLETQGFPELIAPKGLDITEVERGYWRGLRLAPASQHKVDAFLQSQGAMENHLAVQVQHYAAGRTMFTNGELVNFEKWILERRDEEMEAQGPGARATALDTRVFLSVDSEHHLNVFRAHFKNRVLLLQSPVVEAPASLSKYAPAPEKNVALVQYNIATVEDAFVAKRAKHLLATEAIGRRSISDFGMLFLRLWWAEHDTWTPCVERGGLYAGKGFVDWNRHPPNTDCEETFRSYATNRKVWPLGADLPDEPPRQPATPQQPQLAPPQTVQAPPVQVSQPLPAQPRPAASGPQTTVVSGFDAAWKTVPELGFSPDGPPAPAEKYVDNGLLTDARPKPGEQWEGQISAELAEFIDPMSYIKPIDSIETFVKRAINNEMILLVSGISYRNVLLNFIWILEKRFGIYNYGIACMDEAMCTWLESVGKRDMAYRMDEGRLELAYQLLKAGVNLFMTDSDAVWIKNPLPHLRSADITGQRDRHPKSLYLEWGSTFCTGLLGIKSTPMTVKFLGSFVAMLNPKIKFLDQRTFNFAIDRAGVDWFGKQLVHGHGESKTIDRGVLRKFGNTSVAILPQDPYRRLCSERQGAEMQINAAVIHCTGAKKKGGTKVDALKMYHLWVLPEDWETKLDTTASLPRKMFNDEPWVDIVDRIRNGEYRGVSNPTPDEAKYEAQIPEDADAEEDEEEVEGADPRADPRLWKAVMSPEHGRQYWYNLVTRETRWTKPDVLP